MLNPIKGILLGLLFPLSVFSQTGVKMEMKVTTSKLVGGKIILFYDKPGMRMDFVTESSQQADAQRFKVTTLIKSDIPDTVYRINESSKSFTAIESKYFTRQDNQKYTFTVLGDEMMNGYMCKHVELKSSNNNFEFWTTKDIDAEKFAMLLNMDARWGSSSRRQILKEAGADGFPVKMIQKSEQLGITTLELTKFEKVNLDKSNFEIPASFTRSRRPETGKGIQNMSKEQRDSVIKEMIRNKQEKGQTQENKK